MHDAIAHLTVSNAHMPIGICNCQIVHCNIIWMIEKMTNNVWIPSDLSRIIQDDAFRRWTAVRKGHSPAPLQTLILIPSVRAAINQIRCVFR